jgi:pathogenesis-related protein 1
MKFSLFILVLLFFMGQPDEKRGELSRSEKKAVIEAHNKWREKVGVKPLKWSAKLADDAQAWAEHLASSGCKMVHAKSNDGENIYWSDYASKPEEVVDYWCSEIRYYRKPTPITKGGYRRYGHYTQVVWHATEYVGCGRAVCKNGEEIWVCRYSPQGNVLGEKAY